MPSDASRTAAATGRILASLEALGKMRDRNGNLDGRGLPTAPPRRASGRQARAGAAFQRNNTISDHVEGRNGNFGQIDFTLPGDVFIGDLGR